MSAADNRAEVADIIDPFAISKRNELRELAGNVLRPIKHSMNLIEWSDKYRILPNTAAKPGRFITARVPQAVPIYKAIIDTPEVAVVAPTQMLKTELLINTALYYCLHIPSSVLLLTVDDHLKEQITDRFHEALEASPELLQQRDYSGSSKKNTKPPTIRFRTGGRLEIANIHSKTATISAAARVVLIDEVDKVSKGSLIDDARDRTQSFQSRGRVILVSSPSATQSSLIWKAFERGTAERWHISCPHCRQLQEPTIAQPMLTTTGVVYRCVFCEYGMNDTEFSRASDEGEYIAKHRNATMRSFHIHGLSNPLKKMSEVVLEYLELRSAYEKGADKENLYLRFRASRLAEAFDSAVLAELDVKKVSSMRSKYTRTTLPDEVLVLTMGVDTQDDRLECEVAGWGWDLKREKILRWGIEYQVFEGIPETNSPVWDELIRAYVFDKGCSPYTYASGRQIKPIIMFIDSAGHYTKSVYSFASRLKTYRVFACKTTWRLSDVSRPSKVGVNEPELQQTPFMLVSANSTKHRIFTEMQKPVTVDAPATWLWPENPEGLNAGYDEKYFKGFCAERRVPKARRSEGIIEVFEKIPGVQRNEPIDIAMLTFEAVQYISEQRVRFEELKRQQKIKRGEK